MTVYDNSIELIDFHSHILPGIDDGASTPDVSLKMLKILRSQGVDKIVATPHFYRHDETVADFAKRREKAFNTLQDVILHSDCEIPRIIRAAEVRLYPGLWQEEDIGVLCVEGTKVILVEMPYEKWSGWMFNELYALCTKGYLPVVVHVERYIRKYATKDEILKKLLGMSVMVQCNAESFKEFGKRRLIHKILLSGKLAAIGSDCHNVSDRKPDFDVAVNYITKKYGPDCLWDISEMSGLLLKGDIYSLI